MQSSFAAFHFCVTGATLYIASKAPFRKFVPKIPSRIQDMLPLGVAMCLNVVLPNYSLAFSSVTFYQIARILLTPTVALVRYIWYGTVVPTRASLTLIPLLLGVAVVVYFETRDTSSTSTTWAGVVFAFTGVVASSLYTIWISTCQKSLDMNSMQLLQNQAPMSAFLLLFAIPFTDHSPQWVEVPISRYMLIALVSRLLIPRLFSCFFPPTLP